MGVAFLGFRLSHDDADLVSVGVFGGSMGIVWALRNMPLGRSVSCGLYSITKSLSCFSLVGDTGAPSRIGADSPVNRSPMIRFALWAFSESELLLLFNLGKTAANDLARECNTLPFLDSEAVAGCALDIDDSNREPRAGRDGDATLGGVAI